MPFIDTTALSPIERLPGWTGRFFHSTHTTIAHYDFADGASIHEHFHPQEEIYEVITGALEISVEGETRTIKPGLVAIVPSNARHSVKALTAGRVIIIDSPSRLEING